MRMPTCRSRRRLRGSTLVEGLLAIVIFSVGLVGLLTMLSAAMVDGANAQYRSEAGLLASDLVGRMWTGDRSLAGLRLRFGDPNSVEYDDWRRRVQAVLPGVTDVANVPQVRIGEQRDVTITLGWQAPGEAAPHQLLVHTRIGD